MYEIFEELLKNNGLTAYKVSQEAKVPQSTLSDWKRGRSIPKVDKLQKLADYFGVSVDYLMGLNKTVAPIETVAGLSPEYINIMVEAKDEGFSPDDIKLALSLLRMARDKK
ncbi:helix-turn-helix transcriptional regulator [Aminipila butyrica]|uniref:Helix-turn-helix transcriptional regulator n=1 Tax=Aminipila butyrica TaxID=433296 RepID=A0A858BSZ2_9FIRM|nr:helix-turn-helix transcriptional regulator [Aminipila butyrica]QIB68225.1 helix-turn-helix transcriptional regulator [Aminipila butyrica]